MESLSPTSALGEDFSSALDIRVLPLGRLALRVILWYSATAYSYDIALEFSHELMYI